MSKIRRATAADAPEIARIYTPYVLTTTAAFHLDPPSADEFRTRIDRLSSFWPFLVLEGASLGTLGAFGFAEPYSTRPGFAWIARIWTFVDIALDPDAGVPLCRTIVEALRKMGLWHVWASLGADNERIEAVYTEAGFNRRELFLAYGYKLGKWYDVVYLGIALWEGGEPDRPPLPFPEVDGAASVRDAE
jgi:phosphinothricin acetyltransferase